MSSKALLSLVVVCCLVVGLIVFSMNERKSIALNPTTENTESAAPLGQSLSALNVEKDPSVVSQKMSPEAVKRVLENKLPGAKVRDIGYSPIKGFYHIILSGQLLYVSDDAKYMFTGNLLELAPNAPINHTEYAMAAFQAKQAPVRAKIISEIKDSDMVVFKAEKEKHVVTIFTDVDCAYCRKLHKEIPQLNKLGVTVRYLGYPRAGIGSDSHMKLVSIWCSKNKIAAMDDAKLKRVFGNESCDNPIAEQFHLTQQFGLSGTPAIVLDDGELIGGYIPFNELIKHLETKAAQKQDS